MCQKPCLNVTFVMSMLIHIRDIMVWVFVKIATVHLKRAYTVTIGALTLRMVSVPTAWKTLLVCKVTATSQSPYFTGLEGMKDHT